MHWVLALTLINTSASALVGNYESEEACKNALRALWSVSPREPISVACVHRDNPMIRIFEEAKADRAGPSDG